MLFGSNIPLLLAALSPFFRLFRVEVRTSLSNPIFGLAVSLSFVMLFRPPHSFCIIISFLRVFLFLGGSFRRCSRLRYQKPEVSGDRGLGDTLWKPFLSRVVAIVVAVVFVVVYVVLFMLL